MFLCPSASVQDNSKSYQWIFLGGLEHRRRILKIFFTFCGNLDSVIVCGS